MKNKEELQKHIQLLNEIKSRYPILNDTIKYLEEYKQSLSNPTLSECIKEWEERGYIIEISIIHIWFSTVDGNIIATFDLCDKCVTTSLFIDYELSVLITKTLKALEVKNDS